MKFEECQGKESDTMDKKGILVSIREEYQEFKAGMMACGVEKMCEESCRITAWRYIEDFLEGTSEGGADLLEPLYEKAGRHILSTLVDEYMDSECCDIGSWSEIRNLAIDYLRFS